MPPTTVNLQVRVPPDLAERFRTEATTRGLSLGALLAELMDGSPPSMQAHAPEHAEGANLHASVHALAERVAELEQRIPTNGDRTVATKIPTSGDPLPERRKPRKARRVKLTDEQRAELLLVPEDFPRTGQQLRDWRKHNGLGTPPLGEACGVSYQAVQQWERKGDGPLREDVILKLWKGARALRLAP